MIPKQNNLVSNAIRKSAKGEDCTLNLLGVCNHNPETTVFAHLKSGTHGMGLKGTDLIGAYACSSCHDFIDGRVYKKHFDDDYLYCRKYTGLILTLALLNKKRILSCSEDNMRALFAVTNFKISCEDRYLALCDQIQLFLKWKQLSVKGAK